RALHDERTRADKALERVHDKVASINQDSFVLSEKRRQLEELKEDLRREADQGHETLKPLDDAKIEALRRLDAAPFSDADAGRLASLAPAVADKARRRKILDDLVAKIGLVGNVSALLEAVSKERGALEQDRISLAAEVERLQTAEEAFESRRTAVEGRRQVLEGERKQLHVLEGQAAQLDEIVRGLEADAARLRESERARDEVRVRLEIVDVLVDRVFHKKGVVMYAVDQLLPELEIEASKNLAELTDGRFSRIKLETYEEGRGHGIRIRVQGVDGLWHDVGEFSGGEKTQINAALRFAIAKELASLPQVGRTYGRMKTLFIDEGDLGSLDTEVSRELFVQKLFRMGEFFDKVILITHLAEVADKFPGRIRVAMTPDRASRADVVA
ncbi:MAG: hypothetical protein ACT4OI_03115, partial [Methanobacteriota archaeon]